MNLFEKYVIAANLACFSLASAGRIEVDYSTPSLNAATKYVANLMQVESINVGKGAGAQGDSLILNVAGERSLEDAKGNPVLLNRVQGIKFKPSDKKETMSVVMKSGALKGEHVFDLQEIEKIEFVEESKTKDTDGDGIPDYMEVHVYGTDPTSKDTDGDGWNDKEEIALFNSNNPTKWNPKISDLPNLLVEMTRTPEIFLNMQKNSTETETSTVTTGESTSYKVASTKNETFTTALMNAWSASLTQTATFGVDKDHFSGARYTVSFAAGYNGSYTSTHGFTLSSTEETNVTKNYSNALAKAKSEGKTVTGAKVCVDAKLSNTGSIAYTVENLTTNLNVFMVSEGMKVVTTLAPEIGGAFTLQPGSNKSVTRKFCNANVPLEQLGNLIYSPGAMFVDASSYKITMNREGKTTDFTEDYTKAVAQTATVVIDYGPNFASKSTREHMVATNYRVKTSNVPVAEKYEGVSVVDLLKILGVKYTEGDIVNARREQVHALKTLDGVAYGVGANRDTSMWFVAVSRAATPHLTDLYSAAVGGFSLDTLMVYAGDRVQFIYNEDHDHDGVPASMEKLLGISDSKVDSDGDGLSDYEEINGWARLDKNGDTVAVFRTNPANVDSDGDDEGDRKMWDKVDPNPNERAKFTNPYIESIVVTNNLTGEEYVAKGKCGVVGYRCAFTVFELDSAIYSGDITARIVTEKPVQGINLKIDGYKYNRSIDKDGDSRHFKFSLNKDIAPLYVSKTNVISLVVTPEDGDAVESKLYINSGLKRPESFSLNRNHDRNGIILEWSPYTDDSRILGYVILRAEGSKRGETVYHNEALSSMNNTIKRIRPTTVSGVWSQNYTDVASNSGTATMHTDRKPVDGMVLGGGVTLLKVVNLEDGTYLDNVGGGSPYYSYRVYAYTKEGSRYYFSPASDIKTRAVGRIKFEYKLDGHGTEYLYAYGFRLDATVRAWFYNGSGNTFPLMHSYDYWFYKAGSVGKGNTVVYEEKSDRRGEGETNDVSMDKKVYSAEIGAQGVMLKVSADYDGGWYNAPVSTHEIRWPYAKMAAVLKGTAAATSENDNAPKTNWSTNKFNWGQSGIEYNTADNDTGNGCDNKCGDEPHAGLKFKINYNWADPD